jgi:hypothetical protein
VAGFLLRQLEREANVDGGLPGPKASAGSGGPTDAPLGQGADHGVGPRPDNAFQAALRWFRHVHQARDFLAFAALLKVSLVLLTLFISAPEFERIRRISSLGGASTASVWGRSVPGVPVRAAAEPKVMKPVKRLVLPGIFSLPLLFALGAQAQSAVEWKISEGGNGHWYQVYSGSGDWDRYGTSCTSRGGHLATIASLAENTKIRSLVPTGRFYLGGYQPNPNGSAEPAGGWVWITGEPWSFVHWSGSEPNNLGETQHWLVMYEDGTWDDGTFAASNVQAFACEWEADCNGDGIVDYGQILSGELIDANGNGVPDCCESGETCLSGLVANGSFEAGSPLASCASESITSGNLLGSGWQVSAGTVDRTRGGAGCATATQPKFGDYCIDLCGTPASSGAIRQIVATIPGHKYRCTFWLSGDASAAPGTKKVHAKVGSYVDLSYTFACAGSGAQSWVMNQFEFTARGASEALEFAADNGLTTAGPMIDAISLVDITTQCVGDIDDNGDVDGADIALLLLNFGPCSSAP